MSRWLILIPMTLALAGCGSKQAYRTARLGDLYYQHQYSRYRETVRPTAHDRKSTNIVIDNLRLGIGSLADGDPYEAESALLRAYEYLTSGGVNQQDRVVASTLLYEGLKVWTGEPFEQAMAYYYISTVFMMQGDWENGRAAAVNSLFALRSFKNDDPRQPTNEVVESEFVLGYTLAAVNAQLSGRPDLAEQWYKRVLELRPEQQPLIDTLRSGDFDTLLLLDVGRGPTRQAYGNDLQYVRYVPDGRNSPPLAVGVKVDGQPRQVTGTAPLVDLWRLSQYPRWWSYQSSRETRSTLGDVLVIGGVIAAGAGSSSNSDAATWAGLGAVLAGAALKGSAEADLRQLTCLPRCVFVVPMKLGDQPHGVSLEFQNDARANATWHELSGGKIGQPAVYFLRMHNTNGAGMPNWPDRPLYTMPATIGPRAQSHYLFGGSDLSPPDDQWLGWMHEIGRMTDITYDRWEQILRNEGLVMMPGPQGQTGKAALDPRLYQHVADGGKVLWAPRPGTYLYETLTRYQHRPYVPRTAELQQLRQQYGPDNTQVQKVETNAPQ